jgi:hypothetical protein
VLRKVGIDRMVFGSDYPLDDPGHAIEASRVSASATPNWNRSCTTMRPRSSGSAPGGDVREGYRVCPGTVLS